MFVDVKNIKNVSTEELKDAFKRGKDCLANMFGSVYTNILSDELETIRRELANRNEFVNFEAKINIGYGSEYFL